MKAIVQERYGAPTKALELRDVTMPVLEDDSVLIRVRASSINSLDWRHVRANPPIIRLMRGLFRPKVKAVGVDLAGIVTGIGKQITRLKPGDEVFGGADGSFAEYVSASEKDVTLKPKNLTFGEAAAMPIAGYTALRALRDSGKTKPGQRVLIYGAGGGVGTFAVQIAKALGAHVTAVTNSESLDLVRDLGADDVIDFTKEDFTRDGKRYDVLIDISGNRSLTACLRAVQPEGVLVVVGTKRFGHIVKALIWHRLGARRVVPLLAHLDQEGLVRLKELAETGKVTPAIDRRFPLGEVPVALQYFETRGVRGKVVIDVA